MALTQPEEEISNEYEISVEEAIETLSKFLESENMLTKASALNRGEYTVTKWGGLTSTKAKMNPPLYCINFKGDSGSAVLAADKRQSQKIYCVTDNSKITANDLESSKSKLQKNKKYEKKIDDVSSLPIGGCDESLAPSIICLSSETESDNADDSDISNEKYGPLLMTKWSQGKPFNNRMNGTAAGCVPVATAQLIYYFNDKMEPDPVFLGKECDWGTIGTVCPYWRHFFLGTEEAKEQIASYMLDVKWKCNIHTYHTSGTVGGVEACIRQFGFRNVHHDFAHFGGNRHDLNHLDKVIEMIRNGKPVVMLAFCAEGWPWDWNGHAYVIDGYKSDETGRYFHINWGWNGKQDGYYAVGCFNERSRSGIEEGIDSGYKDAKPSNYNLFHYYVHYEI